MARITLDLPETFEFSTEIPIRITDINYGNHLGNDSVLSLIHEARVQFFIHLGFKESNIDGFHIAITDAVIVYQSQGLYGDIVVFDIARGDINKYGCDVIYRLTHKETGKEIARAKTGFVFFDYEKQKVAEMPDRFKRSLNY